MSLSLVTSCTTLAEWFSGLLDSDSLTYASFPARPSGAVTGSFFLTSTSNYASQQREDAILNEVLNGNVPEFVRNLVPIELEHTVDGQKYTGTVYVSPDYLAIGSDHDFVRMPMTPITAQKIADKFGFVLPTRKLVNEIYKQANVKLTPKPLPPGRKMTSNAYYRSHNQAIESQLNGADRARLVAGHKKDIVVTNRLIRKPFRVAIYGWHRPNGQAIQPLSLVHGNKYADYSHGVRLVRHMMRVGNRKMSVDQVLRDPNLSGLLSDEGTIQNSRLQTDLLSDRARDNSGQKLVLRQRPKN